MKKNKIVSLVSTIAAIAIVQACLSVPASAAVIEGKYTNMKFEVLGGGFSYAPYQLSVNPSGELCTRDVSGLTFQLNSIMDYYAIKSVDFKVIAYESQAHTSYTKTISADISEGSCYEQFKFSSLPLKDNYTVEVYANDNYGNTYTWTEQVKRDRTLPTIDGIGVYAKEGGSYTAPDGNTVVNSDAWLKFTVNDINPFYSSWIKNVSVRVYDSIQGNLIKDVIVAPDYPYFANRNIGGYTVDLDLAKYGYANKKLTAYITAKDYAGNERTQSKVFYYQR